MYVIWHSRANLSYQLMKHPDFLDNRDFTGEDKKRPSTMSMDSSYQALEGAVKKLSEIASTRHDPRYLQEYIKTGINMAQSAASDHDFTVLIRSGREDQAMMTTLAGLVVVLSILVKQISALFVTIKSLFAL